MAFKVINAIPGVGKVTYNADPTAGFVIGDLLIRDVVTKRVTTASSTSNIAIVEAIASKTETTGAATATISAFPIVGQTYVVADTAADTHDNQLLISHALTSSQLVDNTSTHISTSAAIFTAINRIGTPGTRKLFGYITKVPQGAY